METIDKQFSNADLVVSNQSRHFLLYAAKWSNFLAIMGFIGLGLMVLGGLIVMLMGSAFSNIPGAPPMSLFGIIYLAMAALYFFPTYYLYLFSQKMKNALANSSQNDLETGFENLKSFFKFMGIFTIVIMSLYVLMILIGMIAGAALM